MHQLAVPPVAGERAGCASSYDRHSRYDEQTHRYIDWDANDDGGGVADTLPDGSIVALSLKGPGVIWRSWSAMPNRGHIRVYIDGGAQPVIDRPFIDYFTRFGEDFAPLNLPALCPHISRGYNSFLPIPFQSEIRIEFAPEWGRYFHFTYTQLPQGTTMPDYREHFSVAGRRLLAQLDRDLYLRGHRVLDGQRSHTAECQVPPQGNATLLRQEGPGAITGLQLQLPPEAGGEALRDLVLTMTWDGDAEPAVCAPIGDFFGCGPAASPTYTWPVGIDGHRMYAHWYMPFAQGARVEIQNVGDRPYAVRCLLITEALRDAQNLLRFHAKWHRDAFRHLDQAEFAPGGQRFPDWPMLLVDGTAGRFCGMHLHIHDTWPYPTGDAATWWFGYGGEPRVNWWWGEGDEKFFVDGEKFPSTFGTGSEDYIGYAWAAEPPFALFDSPFAANGNVPLDGNGDTSVCRFHVCDNVPFHSSFEAFMEKYYTNCWGEAQRNRCHYSATAIWYQEANRQDGYPVPTAEDLHDYR